jgi:glycosyltransferase involved in cell wall biosynthesis
VADGAVLVAPGDADALAEALRLVLADDALAADLVARGQARVDARSWDRTVGQVVDLYHRAAAAR